MKRKRKNNRINFICLMAVLMVLPSFGFAQPVLSKDSLTKVSFPDSLQVDSTVLDKIPPLSVLIDSAYANSPILKRQNKQIDIRILRKKTVNQEWLKYLSIFATSNYGVYDNFVSVQDQSVVGSTINTGNSFRWSVGVAMSGAPFYDMVNKPTMRKIKQLEMEQEIDAKQDLKIQLKQIVIQQYNQTLASYQMMIIANNNVYSNYTQLVMSEQKFNLGELEIFTLANVREMYYKSLMTYEKNKYEFHSNYMILETICGIEF